LADREFGLGARGAERDLGAPRLDRDGSRVGVLAGGSLHLERDDHGTEHGEVERLALVHDLFADRGRQIELGPHPSAFLAWRDSPLVARDVPARLRSVERDVIAARDAIRTSDDCDDLLVAFEVPSQLEDLEANRGSLRVRRPPLSAADGALLVGAELPFEE